MTDHSNPTLDVIRAAMALAERDVGLGLVTAEQIQAIPRTRFAAVERKQVAALLKAEGKSNREIAEELGVHHKTVGRDLGDGANAPEDGANAPLKERKAKAAPQEADMPTAEEADESHQLTLYDHACLIVDDQMSGETRQKFFAHMRKRYNGQYSQSPTQSRDQGLSA